MKREFDPTGHTPSAVHPKIAYGPSTKKKLRARMDRKIDPSIAGKLKHPVVIHRDKKLHPQVLAAAVPAHQTTGGRGHVVLGPTFKPSGKRKPNQFTNPALLNTRGTVNHELAHAQLKRPPRTTTSMLTNMGEEARADAVSGANLYRKNGAVNSKKEIKAIKREYGAGVINSDGLKINNRYLKVRRLARAAGKLR
jgi:hypothetical protein